MKLKKTSSAINFYDQDNKACIVYKETSWKHNLNIVWKIDEELKGLLKEWNNNFESDEIICDIFEIWQKIFYIKHKNEMKGEYSEKEIFEKLPSIFLEHVKLENIKKTKRNEKIVKNRYHTDRKIKTPSGEKTFRIVFDIKKEKKYQKIRIITIHQR